MKRRTTLKLVSAAGVTASVSGCSSILGGGCGPGTDEIGALAESVNSTETAGPTAAESEETASITGEIQSVGDEGIVVDDGTGTATVTTLFVDATPQDVGDGDCLQASGFAYPPEDDSDIRFIATEIGRAAE